MLAEGETIGGVFRGVCNLWLCHHWDTTVAKKKGIAERVVCPHSELLPTLLFFDVRCSRCKWGLLQVYTTRQTRRKYYLYIYNQDDELDCMCNCYQK